MTSVRPAEMITAWPMLRMDRLTWLRTAARS
ncbi:Uncharacterised protein [Bordetella pertussis]|nr:Uncharacterised protein [Bordetella pertussis]